MIAFEKGNTRHIYLINKNLSNLEANIYFWDVNEVYQSTVNGDKSDDLFLTKDEAIKWTKQVLKELSEELSEDEMEQYGFDKDAESYVEVIDLKHLEEVDGAKRRVATDENENLIVEWYDDEDEVWVECFD